MKEEPWKKPYRDGHIAPFERMYSRFNYRCEDCISEFHVDIPQTATKKDLIGFSEFIDALLKLKYKVERKK